MRSSPSCPESDPAHHRPISVRVGFSRDAYVFKRCSLAPMTRTTGDHLPEFSRSRFAVGVAAHVPRNSETNPMSIVDSWSAMSPYLLVMGCQYCTTRHITFKTQKNSPFVTNCAAFTLRFVGVVTSDAPSAAEAEPLFRVVRTVIPALKNTL